MKRCRYCGGKIEPGASQCKHCGKLLRNEKAETKDQTGLTNINAWKQKTIPSWLMYLVVAFLLFCVWIMFSQTTREPLPEPPADPQSMRSPASDQDVDRCLAVLASIDPSGQAESVEDG